jgi:hypothetical protein
MAEETKQRQEKTPKDIEFDHLCKKLLELTKDEEFSLMIIQTNVIPGDKEKNEEDGLNVRYFHEGDVKLTGYALKDYSNRDARIKAIVNAVHLSNTTNIPMAMLLEAKIKGNESEGKE